MANDPIAALAVRLSHLGSPARLRVLAMLRDGPASIPEIAEAVGVTFSGLSKMVRMMELDGFVTREHRGRCAYYSLVPGAVAATLDEARELLTG